MRPILPMSTWMWSWLLASADPDLHPGIMQAGGSTRASFSGPCTPRHQDSKAPRHQGSKTPRRYPCSVTQTVDHVQIGKPEGQTVDCQGQATTRDCWVDHHPRGAHICIQSRLSLYGLQTQSAMASLTGPIIFILSGQQLRTWCLTIQERTSTGNVGFSPTVW